MTHTATPAHTETYQRFLLDGREEADDAGQLVDGDVLDDVELDQIDERHADRLTVLLAQSVVARHAGNQQIKHFKH